MAVIYTSVFAYCAGEHPVAAIKADAQVALRAGYEQAAAGTRYEISNVGFWNVSGQMSRSAQQTAEAERQRLMASDRRRGTIVEEVGYQLARDSSRCGR